MKQLLPRASAHFIRRVLAGCLLALVFASCVKQTRRAPPANASTASLSSTSIATHINLNTASQQELETLPGVGQVMAARIIEHRERYGRFHRPEDLIMVRGFSDRRFRVLRQLLVAD